MPGYKKGQPPNRRKSQSATHSRGYDGVMREKPAAKKRRETKAKQAKNSRVVSSKGTGRGRKK